jgi:hypothetical protein
MRAAVFYAPEPDDRLAHAGAAWLGRDAERNIPIPQPSPKLACITASPARYGFHATLKPPMNLATSLESLTTDIAAFAARTAPFPLPPLAVGQMGNALALLAPSASASLQNLCDACVETLDSHRLPPDSAELARRHQVTLSAAESAMLARWGYPYVFACGRFHLTLTSALPAKIIADRAEQAVLHFAPALAVRRQVRSLALFIEPAPGAAFVLARRFPLEGR